MWVQHFRQWMVLKCSLYLEMGLFFFKQAWKRIQFLSLFSTSLAMMNSILWFMSLQISPLHNYYYFFSNPVPLYTSITCQDSGINWSYFDMVPSTEYLLRITASKSQQATYKFLGFQRQHHYSDIKMGKVAMKIRVLWGLMVKKSVIKGTKKIEFGRQERNLNWD